MISNPLTDEAPPPVKVLVENGIVLSPEGERLRAQKEAEAAMAHPAVLPPDPENAGLRIPAHLNRESIPYSLRRKKELNDRAAAMKANGGRLSRRATKAPPAPRQDVNGHPEPCGALAVKPDATAAGLNDFSQPLHAADKTHWERVIADLEIKLRTLEGEVARIQMEITEVKVALSVARKMAVSA